MENIEESMDDSFEDETWKPQTNENDYSKEMVSLIVISLKELREVNAQ